MGLGSFRPVTDSFVLVWEHDPALDRERPTFEHDYEVACDTGNWDAITVPGQKPTLFHFRLIDTARLRRLFDIEAGPQVQSEIAFRMSLTKIEDWGADGAPKLDKKPDPECPKLGPLVSRETQVVLDGISLAMGRLAGELPLSLGTRVLNRSCGVRPLSEKG